MRPKKQGAAPAGDELAPFREASQKLRDARISLGLSQEEVAALIEVDQSGLSKAERLGVHLLSVRKFFAFAELCKLSGKIVVVDGAGRERELQRAEACRMSFKRVAALAAEAGGRVECRLGPATSELPGRG